MALSFMVGMLFWRGRSEQALIYTAFSSAQTRFTRIAVLDLLWREGLRQMQEEGLFPTPLSMELEGSPPLKATLTLSPEASRLNLNQADAQALRDLFLEHHIPEHEAEIMADSLLDWRDEDDLHRLNGAEKDYYQDRGYVPRNGPLKDLSEVTLIKGFDPYRFWFNPGIYRWVTIYGGSPRQRPEEEDLEGGISLKAGQIYRLELSFEQGGKTFRYLEIFRYKGPDRKKLFSFSW